MNQKIRIKVPLAANRVLRDEDFYIDSLKGKTPQYVCKLCRKVIYEEYFLISVSYCH